MDMKTMITKWFTWLQSAARKEDHIYSDGQQIWASDGYSLHALDVATEKSGQVTLTEDGVFQVDATEDIPRFTKALPHGEPIASITVSSERLQQAIAGQEGYVRLNLYGDKQALELSSNGKYALVMPVLDVQEWQFWRPKRELSDKK